MSELERRLYPKTLPRRTVLALMQLERRPVFSVDEAKRLGISQPTLSRMLRRGILARVVRGLYSHRASRLPLQQKKFSAACAKFGNHSIIGGASALHFHGLVSKPPKAVWVLVKHQQKTASDQYRCLRTKANPNIGVKQYEGFRITDLERTLVEALRHASKLGRNRVLKAVRKAIDRDRTTERKLSCMALSLGLGRMWKRYRETIKS